MQPLTFRDRSVGQFAAMALIASSVRFSQLKRSSSVRAGQFAAMALIDASVRFRLFLTFKNVVNGQFAAMAMIASSVKFVHLATWLATFKNVSDGQAMALIASSVRLSHPTTFRDVSLGNVAATALIDTSVTILPRLLKLMALTHPTGVDRPFVDSKVLTCDRTFWTKESVTRAGFF